MRILKPIGGRIIVECENKNEVTPGGIHLPQNAEKSGVVGKVLAVGNGPYNPHKGERIPMEVKTGDTVLFPKFAGHSYNNSGQKLVVLTEVDILGVIVEST